MRRALSIFLLVIVVLTAGLVANALLHPPTPRVTTQPPLEAGISAPQVATHLAQAVRIRTVSHERPEDDDASAFDALHSFLEATYPRVHAALAREALPARALVLRWQGTDPALAPVLFLAHQDVVPVEEAALASWTHPPFEGAIADGFVWGRGALDDKGPLVCLFEAMESLLAEGFRPARSVWIASGFDEEVGGAHGARALSEALRARGVRFSWVLDEGGGVTDGVVPRVTRPVASINVAEKGYLSVELLAHGEGGHSSMPPQHGAVAALAAAVTRLEAHPFPARLTPIVRASLARLAPEMPLVDRVVTQNLWLTEPLVRHSLAARRESSPQVRTTIAPTILTAGVKDNVVPSIARAVVNFRILPGDSIAGVLTHVRDAIADPAVEVKPLERMASEPGRLSSTTSTAYRALADTVQRLYPDALVVPGVVNGATDARHFQAIADDVYRFVPRRLQRDDLKRVHGTNERASVADLARTVQGYRLILRSATR